MNLSKLFVSLLLFSVLAVKGQLCSFTLEGRIIDLHEGTPIFGAVVSIEGTTRFGQSDERGYYKIPEVCKGSLKLKITHEQCNTIEKTLFLESNRNQNFELEHHINELNEIILSEAAVNQLNLSLTESRLNAEEIAKLSNDNLAEALSGMAGVSVLKTGSGIAKPMIHGLYGSRVAIVADGMRLQDQEWGADHAPNIDLNGFESVQVVKGVATLRYGGDTPGGMIVLNPQKAYLADSLYGASVINGVTNGKGGSMSAKLTRTLSNGYYYSGQFSLKQFGDRKAPDYILTNTGLKEYAVGMRMGRNKIVKGWHLDYRHFQNTTGILRAAHIGNIEDLLRAIESNIPLRIVPFSYALDAPKQEAKHQNLQAHFFNELNDQSKLILNYSYQRSNRKEYDVRRGNRSGQAAIDLTLNTHDFLGRIEWDKNFDWNFEWGLNGMIQDNFSNPETGVKRLIPDYIKVQAGSYLTGSYRPSTTFNWEWGFRYDQIAIDAKKFYDTKIWNESGYSSRFSDIETKDFGTQILVNPKLNYGNFSGQTGVAIQLGKNLTTRFSYLHTQRAPNISELFSDGLHHSLATIEYGNLLLDKEISHKLLLGINHTGGSLKYGIEPYVNWISDFIFIQPTGVELTIRGAFPVWEYQATDVLMWGGDAYIEMTPHTNIQYKAAAAYTYAQDQLAQNPLINVPPFSLSQQLSYHFPKSALEFELAHRYTAAQKRFPNTNFYISQIESGARVQKEIDISTPPPAFHKFDLYLTWPIQQQSKVNTSLRIIIQNITNTTYFDYLNRLRFYSAELGRIAQIQLIFRY
ncbi:MAG: TonB-dependent receptor [Flavobacteriaceae bacterium]